MRQILFHIPLDRPWNLGPLGLVPGFGFGLVLLVWFFWGAWTLFAQTRASGGKLAVKDFTVPIVNWLVVAAVIVFGAPALGAYWRQNGMAPFNEGLPIFGYGFMLFLGFTTAVHFAARRAQSVGLSSDVIWDLSLWLIIPGIVGARLFFLIQYGDKVFGGIPLHQWPLAAINLTQGGIVLYGALLGGAAGYFTFCYVKRVRPLGLADIIIPSVFVGIGFGRIGCFLNGCCYGRVTTMPWGVQFPKDSVPFAGLVEKHLLDANAECTPLLHPTQIYSSIDGFVIALITSWYFRHRRRNGEVLAVALIIYPITRFCMELLRADEIGKFGTSLTISQWISIALFLINIGFLVYLSKRPAVREPIDLSHNEVGPHAAATSRTA